MTPQEETIDESGKGLAIVIPAFNEEFGIAPTLQDLRALLPDARIIVVDDGSTDMTAEKASSVSGVDVIRHVFNQGYGAALRTGMANTDMPLVAWFDADNEHRAEDLRVMVSRIKKENLAAVIGRRQGNRKSVLRTNGKMLIRLLARTLGVKMGSDINCGLRVFRRSVIARYYGLLPHRFSASLTSSMIIFERGYPFSFHDIEVNSRIGRSKVRLADGFEAMTLVLRMVMLFAPLRIFLAPGVVLLGFGVCYSVILGILNGLGVPTFGILATVSGVLLCMLGLMADQLSQLRLSQLATPTTVDYQKDATPKG